MKVPNDLDSAEVACLLRTYLTAYQCLHRAGKKKENLINNRILVTGASSCLSQAVIQLAQAAGAKQIYATGEISKLSITTRPVGYSRLEGKPNKWLKEVKGKMDIVIDSVCCDGYESSHMALNKKGKLVCVGATSLLDNSWPSFLGQPPLARMNMFKAAYLLKRSIFYDIFEQLDEYPHHYEKDLQRLFVMLRNGSIRPNIVKEVSLHGVAKSHADIEKGGVRGMIVCLPFGEDFRDKKGSQGVKFMNAGEFETLQEHNLVSRQSLSLGIDRPKEMSETLLVSALKSPKIGVPMNQIISSPQA